MSPISLEQALTEAGTGRFQWLMLAICGLANASDAVEVMSVGLMGTAAEQDLQLDAKREGALNSAMLVGMFIGGIGWGLLGDRIGRRRSLLLALFLNALFGALSATAGNLSQLLVMRALAGLGVGGSMPVVFSLMAEMCPIATRGRFMSLLASCWMLGSLFSASMGWIILPTGSWRTFIAVASLPAWACVIAIAVAMPESPRYLLVKGRVNEAESVLRKAAAMNGHPLPTSFSLLPITQHSRKHIHSSAEDLNSHGDAIRTSQTQKATKLPSTTTTHMIDDARRSSNGGKHSSLDGLLSANSARSSMSSPQKSGEFGGNRVIISRSLDLESAPSDPNSCKSGSSLPESHLASWLRPSRPHTQQRHTYVSSPEFAGRSRSGGGASSGDVGLARVQNGQVDDTRRSPRCWGVGGQLSQAWGTVAVLFRQPLVAYTLPLAVAWIGLSGGWYCTVLWVPKYFKERGATGGSLYADTFAVSLANLPGNIASIYLVDWLGRRKTTCYCMAGGCICALLFAIAPAHGVWPLLAACVFNAVSVPGWNSLDMISAELYPTPVRSSGFGLLNSIGRLSSIGTTFAAGALLDVALWAPLVLAAVLLALGSVAMMLLPEPAGQPLEDSMDEEPQKLSHPGSSRDVQRSEAPGSPRSKLPVVNASLSSLSPWASGDGEQVGLLSAVV